MIEKQFILKDIDFRVFYGVNNSNLEHLKKLFPKIKLIARDANIKAIGSEDDISIFEKKLIAIIDFYNNYNKINLDIIDDIVLNDNKLINFNDKDVIIFGNHGKLIKSRNKNQQEIVDFIKKNDLIFAIGPAGTGKTYIAIALAVQALKNKEVKRIILSRPAVEAGEQLGFLPGDFKEKLDPYLQPLYDALFDMIPAKKLTELFNDGIIEIAPLAYMRGRTLENSFVILDEAQNTSVNQIKMFLTRMGNGSKFIVTGDVSQIDLPQNKKSGLLNAIDVLKGINEIKFVFFNKNDVVRHKIVKKIIEAYEKK